MKTPQKVPHADLIENFDFMVWCEKKYKNIDVVKWRYAYIVYVQEVRTAKEAAKKLNVCIDDVYDLVGQYKAAAKLYKAERDAKDAS